MTNVKIVSFNIVPHYRRKDYQKIKFIETLEVELKLDFPKIKGFFARN